MILDFGRSVGQDELRMSLLVLLFTSTNDRSRVIWEVEDALARSINASIARSNGAIGR
jgi:hypothetical protein